MCGTRLVLQQQGRRKELSAAGVQGLGQGLPFVEVRWEMLHHNPSILYFKSLSLVIQVHTPSACAFLFRSCNAGCSLTSEHRFALQTRIAYHKLQVW